MIRVTERTDFVGTMAERLAITDLSRIKAGSTFKETDTGTSYVFDGTQYVIDEHQSPVLLTAGVSITGTFKRIKAKTDCTFTTFTSNATFNSPTTLMTAENLNTDGGLEANTDIWAVITAVTLTTGSCWLYR